MRPEWLPPEYEYRRRYPATCDYCAAPVVNTVALITMKTFTFIKWCDDCDSRARAAITGETE
jgi:hypothetical protein